MMTKHPNFENIYLLDDPSVDAQALSELLKEDYISLVIIKREVDDFDTFLESADLACTQEGSLGKERVLMIEKEEVITLLKAVSIAKDETTNESLENEVSAIFLKDNPTENFTFDDIVAFSVFPITGKIAYAINNENANFIEVDMAFSTVVSNLSQ